MPAALKIISSMATRQILAGIIEARRAQSGEAVELEALGGVTAAARLRAGAVCDIAVLAEDALGKLAGEGHLIAGSLRPFARSPIAMACRAGGAVPDVSSNAAARDSLCRAGRIALSSGPSGRHLMDVFAGWGDADPIARRLVLAPPGVPVGSMVARGEAEVGFQQLSELLEIAGLHLVRDLPADLQTVTIFSAGLSRLSPDPARAATLLEHLVSADAAALKHRFGMAPA